MANLNCEDNVDDVNSIAKCRKINVNDSSETLNSLEDIIINEILPRLAVKTLIRFKSVCKSWHSIISSPEFVKMHFNFSSFSAHQFILHNFFTSKFISLPYDEFNNIKNPVDIRVLDFRYFQRHPHEIEVMGVCNGLLCLHSHCTGDDRIAYSFFSICNPATNQYCEIDNPYSPLLMLAACHWFGYVPSMKDYKILASFDEYSNSMTVYSLKSGTWKELDVFDRPLSRPIIAHFNTIMFDYELYWVSSDISNKQRIVRFNLVTEQVKEFPGMDWLSVYADTEFLVMNECLSLYCSSNDLVSDVWMLKQRDDWTSWEKSFSLHHGGFSLHSVSPTGKFLLNRREFEPCESDEFKIIDASKDTQDQSHGDPYCCDVDTIGYGGGFYVESLIWPIGETKSTEEEDHEV